MSQNRERGMTDIATEVGRRQSLGSAESEKSMWDSHCENYHCENSTLNAVSSVQASTQLSRNQSSTIAKPGRAEGRIPGLAGKESKTA